MCGVVRLSCQTIDHLRRTVQRHSDRIAAARAGADQAGGHAARHMVEVAIGPALLLEGQRGAARQRLDLAFEQADDVDQRLGLGSGVAARGEEGEVGGFVGMLGEAPQEFDEGRADRSLLPTDVVSC